MAQNNAPAAPRRYGPNGRLWNGKRPEEFNEGDVRAFLADTDALLHGKDDFTMATNTKTAAQAAPADMDTRAGQDAEAYLLFEAPIAELAGALKVDIDEAVRLRVEAAVGAAPMKLDVSVRPIEPRGKLIGIASVNFGGGLVVDDFKVFNGEKGLFVGAPSKPDNSTRSGYRRTARITDDKLQEALDSAAFDAYNAEVEKLQTRAAAVRSAPDKPRIREQLDKAAQEAAKDNAARPAPEKAGKAVRDDR